MLDSVLPRFHDASGRALLHRVLFLIAFALLAGELHAASHPPVGPTPKRAPAVAAFYAAPFEKRPDAAALTALGRSLFFDSGLSASGRLACASCHDPAHAYGPPNALAVQFGGASNPKPGVRAVPSLMYQQDTPPFSEHFSDTDGDDSIDQGPTGGRGWDGRASSAHEQAAIPLLSPFEMANADSAAVIERLRHSPSAAGFRSTFGDHVLDDPSLAWTGVLWALEVFQQSPEDFYPYSSKYDAFLRRLAQLTPAELRGLAVFNDPGKGNCAICHPSDIKRGAFPQFTDHGFIAVGVPRNRQIPANADSAYHDLGLCGPLRGDLRNRAEYCGLFKTPSLRNVARRQTFFHNGVFHRLEDALAFYAERDVNPARFYSHGVDGKVQKFDDLPPRFRENVNLDAPFDRKPGGAPAFSRADIADLIAFLRTLDDGYVDSTPKAAMPNRSPERR